MAIARFCREAASHSDGRCSTIRTEPGSARLARPDKHTVRLIRSWTLASRLGRERRTLSTDPLFSDDDAPGAASPTAALWVCGGMLGLMAAGFLAYFLLSTPPPPPPPEVAGDPLLLEGRTIYLARCTTCHGREGRGDGPIAGYLLGPPVGNISDGKWKHGDKPSEVLAVIAKGVQGTRHGRVGPGARAPSGFAVTAYVLYLAKQPIPEELRRDRPEHPDKRELATNEHI